MKVIALDSSEAGSITMPDRFRREIVYFMTPTDQPGSPQCGPNEYWIPYHHSVRWLDEGVFTLVSPLDAESQAEIELTEDQERWLEWMVEFKVTHIRLEE